MSLNFYAAVEGGATKGAQSNWLVTPTLNTTQHETALEELAGVGKNRRFV